MTKINTTWLAAFDKELWLLFCMDHADAGMDDDLLRRYVGLPPREAALAYERDYDLERNDALWPRPGLEPRS
ncbi:TPA: hypothetical protein ACGY72_003094 [Stenotrophomonas maltophilia]